MDKISDDYWTLDYTENALSIMVYTDKMSDTTGTLKKLNKLLKDIKL